MTPVPSRRPMFAAALAAVLFVSFAAPADTFRVAPGENWSALSGRVGPGDVIELLPGRHRPASFSGLAGTGESPIVIRGAGPAAVIAAGNSGLYLRRPRWVVLEDFAVEGASHNGINIDDQDAAGTIGGPWEAHLVLRGVSVRDTGPTGNLDGIKLSGLASVRVENCTVEGWGGSAIDMVGCHEVVITGSVFRGREGYSQASGVQIKGGSAGVRIEGCRFDHAGMRAVNLGGSTGLEYFRPPVPADARPGSWFEARDVTVSGCVFEGGASAVAFVGATGAVVTRCTIVRPTRWPFRLLQETRDPRFGPAMGARIEHCLIVAETLAIPVNIGDATGPDSFVWGPNLWWADGLDAGTLTGSLPGTVAAEQVVRDPALDDALRPAAEDLRRFGAAGAAGAAGDGGG